MVKMFNKNLKKLQTKEIGFLEFKEKFFMY